MKKSYFACLAVLVAPAFALAQTYTNQQITFYLLDSPSAAGGTITECAPAFTQVTSTGWLTKNIFTQCSDMAWGTVRPVSSWTSPCQMSFGGVPGGTTMNLRSQYSYTGTLSAGQWSLALAGYTHSGNASNGGLRYGARIWISTASDCNSGTQVNYTQSGAVYGVTLLKQLHLTTANTQNNPAAVATVSNPNTFTLNNHYICVELDLNSNTTTTGSDIVLVQDAAHSYFISPPFTGTSSGSCPP